MLRMWALKGVKLRAGWERQIFNMPGASTHIGVSLVCMCKNTEFVGTICIDLKVR